MTGLQSCPPEIFSLICQDPILERLDLNSIHFTCFFKMKPRGNFPGPIVFPCLRGASGVKAWCSAIRRNPHLATKVEVLVLRFPPPFTLDSAEEDVVLRLTLTNEHVCV